MTDDRAPAAWPALAPAPALTPLSGRVRESGNDGGVGASGRAATAAWVHPVRASMARASGRGGLRAEPTSERPPTRGGGAGEPASGRGLGCYSVPVAKIDRLKNLPKEI